MRFHIDHEYGDNAKRNWGIIWTRLLPIRIQDRLLLPEIAAQRHQLISGMTMACPSTLSYARCAKPCMGTVEGDERSHSHSYFQTKRAHTNAVINIRLPRNLGMPTTVNNYTGARNPFRNPHGTKATCSLNGAIPFAMLSISDISLHVGHTSPS